jgi:hypothetical protein
MKIYVRHNREGLAWAFREEIGWYWMPENGRKWRGPFGTKTEVLHSASTANPDAEIAFFDPAEAAMGDS